MVKSLQAASYIKPPKLKLALLNRHLLFFYLIVCFAFVSVFFKLILLFGSFLLIYGYIISYLSIQKLWVMVHGSKWSLLLFNLLLLSAMILITVVIKRLA